MGEALIHLPAPVQHPIKPDFGLPVLQEFRKPLELDVDVRDVLAGEKEALPPDGIIPLGEV